MRSSQEANIEHFFLRPVATVLALKIRILEFQHLQFAHEKRPVHEDLRQLQRPLSADIPSTSYCAITDLSKHSLVHLSQETMNLPSKR